MGVVGSSYYADTTAPASIAAITAAMASAEAAQFTLRTIQTFTFTNAAQRTSESRMRAGDQGFQIDTKVNYFFDGTNWVVSGIGPWQSYTGSPTNFTIGTGGAAYSLFEYRTENDLINVRYQMTLGTSGASVGAGPSIALPVTAATLLVANQVFTGNGAATDVSAGFVPLTYVSATSTTRVQIIAAAAGNITSTVPFTWAAGDTAHGSFVYKPA